MKKKTEKIKKMDYVGELKMLLQTVFERDGIALNYTGLKEELIYSGYEKSDTKELLKTFKNSKMKFVIEVERDEIFNRIVDDYIERFEEDAKDMAINGIQFKGVEKMSDKELIKEYKDLVYIDDMYKIKIVSNF